MTSVLPSKATRWVTVLVATSLVLAFLVGGDQRSATAIGPGETKIAYVADGYNFPDALMGATVAALNAAPMLGVRGPNSGDFVPDRTAAELDRLTNDKANKLDTIYIFGGPAAVSDNVKAELAKWANNVERIFGQDRFGTMEAISKALPSKVKDSDLLDGKDSSAFLGKTEKAADSDLLDGKDSSGFLGATETATDSELLDGMDSTDFLGATGLVVTSSNWESFGTSTVGTGNFGQRVISGGGVAVEFPTLPPTLGGLDLSMSAARLCYDAATNGTTLTRFGVVTNTATNSGLTLDDPTDRTDSGCVTLTFDTPVLLDRDTSFVGFVNFNSGSGDLIVGSMSYTLVPADSGHMAASSMSAMSSSKTSSSGGVNG